jgi:hypothetical protein
MERTGVPAEEVEYSAWAAPTRPAKTTVSWRG